MEPPVEDAAPPAEDAALEDAAPPVPDMEPPAPDPLEGPIADLSPYVQLDWAAVHRLRAVFDAARTHPCEVQVVGDSISETFLFLNPLTTDRRFPDMAYADPTHCRLFGQPSIFLDVLQTAASGTTAGWGLDGFDGWGGVRNLAYPMTYTDRDGGRNPTGRRQAWPEIATVMFGTNDLRAYLRDRHSWDPSPAGEAEARARYVADMRGIAQWFLDHGVVPVLLTIPPGRYEAYVFRPEGAGWGDRAGRPLGEVWADAVRALGAELQVPVVDVNRALADRPDWAQLLSDDIHPNNRGYAEVINPRVHDAYVDLRRLVLRR
jgi:lysophospholipase L1-like esterase